MNLGRSQASVLLALALASSACGGMGVRQDFEGRGGVVAPGQPGPVITPKLTVSNGEGEALTVEAYTWANAQAAGSGTRTPDHWTITSGDLTVLIESGAAAMTALVAHDDESRAVIPEPVGGGLFRIQFPSAGLWQVDLFSISGSNYALFAFTVDAE